MNLSSKHGFNQNHGTKIQIYMPPRKHDHSHQ